MTSPTLDIVTVDTDVVVVGGGGAAARAALSARQAGARVHLMCKAPPGVGGSTVFGASEIMSMGAAAGFGDARDAPEVHFEDTMRAGRGFIDEALVRVLAEEAPARIHDLIALGVPFDRTEDGSYKQIRSDFGTYGRAMGVKGHSGRYFVEALSAEMTNLGVEVDTPVMLVDLVRDGNGELCGVLGYDPSAKRFVHYRTPAAILGTGGMHAAFTQQVSTAEMTGDGQAICFRHGAELVNMEFHQFGPALIRPYVQAFSKSIFVLDPRITNTLGEEFLPRYLPPGLAVEEAFADKVFPFTTSNPSRWVDVAIAREIDEGRGNERGAVFFSFAHADEETLKATTPNTFRWLAERGINMGAAELEVAIAFQCMNGGVRMTDADGQSTIPGLYAIGEVAGGVRGPDRPGGNSLAEGQVFGHRAGVAAAGRARGHHRTARPATLDESLSFLAGALDRPSGVDVGMLASGIRDKMQRHCLVEKTEEGLSDALDTVLAARRDLEADLALTPETLVEGLGVRNLAEAAELVLRACLHRRETRSGHYRLDYPETDDTGYRLSFAMRRDGDGVAIEPCPYH
jgi:succinate dehydrogenase/fumarate reductase flavoprotein subunit